MVHVVGDEDHRDAFGARLVDQLQHVEALLHAERGGRLVENQHARAEMDCARDRQALLLAAGHGADRLMRVAHVDAHFGELVARGRGAGFEVHHVEEAEQLLLRLAAHEEIARDRQQRHQRQILIDGRDADIERVFRRLEMHRLAVHQIFARRAYARRRVS